MSGNPVQLFDVAMSDLDGVIYISGAVVPGASEGVKRARSSGLHVTFVTNNASRTPQKVAENLAKLGIPATAQDVVTSSQAAAHLLLTKFGLGSPVAVLGGEGLHTAVAAAGLRVTAVSDLEAQAVVTGYGPDVLWKEIMQAATRIRDGLTWVATNTDESIPTKFGLAPGHGIMVKMLSDFSGMVPQVAGKPSPPLLEETIRRTDAKRPIMVGDRLDTDIEGAHNVGVPSLLVMTGVTSWHDLFVATPQLRPTFIADNLLGLTEHHNEVTVDQSGMAAGGWRATVKNGQLLISGAGSRANWLRVAAKASWDYCDATGHAPDLGAVVEPTCAQSKVG
jgi:glycerol-1-phosphatase